MNNKSVFWKSPELNGLELQKATYRTHAFTPHFHDEYAIGVFLRGAQEKFYRGATHTVFEGCICVINPGEIHYGYPIDEHGWTYRMVYVSADLVQNIAAQMFGEKQDYPYFPELLIKDETLFDNIVKLHHTFEIPGGSLLKKESDFIFVLEELLRKYSDIPPKNYRIKSSSSRIKTVREYIDQHYDQEISLEKLAGVAELSPYYLLRLFKKETGATPHIYLTQRRINKAKHFLTSGDSLTDVAYKTGFSDQSHFTHRFKNIVGITPGQYSAHLA